MQKNTKPHKEVRKKCLKNSYEVLIKYLRYLKLLIHFRKHWSSNGKDSETVPDTGLTLLSLVCHIFNYCIKYCLQTIVFLDFCFLGCNRSSVCRPAAGLAWVYSLTFHVVISSNTNSDF